MWEIPVTESVGPFRAAYDFRVRSAVDFSEDTHGSNVKQSFKDEVDVNNIVVRFRQTGVLPGMDGPPPRYLDVSEVPDYRDALHQVQAVNEFFAGLPADTRAEFGNDPGFFAEWITDPANVEEAAKYGVSNSGSGSGADSSDGAAAEAETAAEEVEGGS